MIEGQLEALSEHAEGKEVAQRRAYAHGKRRPARIPGHAGTSHELDAALPGGRELEGREPRAETFAAEKVVSRIPHLA